MKTASFPGCCTSAVIYSLGEHGEPSIVTANALKAEVQKLMAEEKDLDGHVLNHPMHCLFAISVDPKNVKEFEEVGFKIVDTYKGIQGICHIMTFHA